MSTIRKRKELAERALKIFVLHYYSLDWIREFLLERRFQLIFSSKRPFIEYSARSEEDLLICLKTAIDVFPTARGLQCIDIIVRQVSEKRTTAQRTTNDFSSLATFFCTATRYRMSLFALADRARESHHDDLVSLWVIAATAKLDHVSAYRAYAAAKEEEARLLNCIDGAQYWKAKKCFVGDLAKVQFDAKLMIAQEQKESHDRDQAFRCYLQSKADKSLHEMIETCDFSGPMFLAIWCNIKSHSVQHVVTGSMWKLASELFRTEQEALAKTVVMMAFGFEDSVNELQSIASRYRKKSQESDQLKFWGKAVSCIECAILKIRLLIEQFTVNYDIGESKEQLETLKQSIMATKSLFHSPHSGYAANFSIVFKFDSLLNSVLDLLPVLIAHPEHSFPEFKLLLQEKCERWGTDLERYVEIADAYIRCRIDGNEPSEKQWNGVDTFVEETESRSFLLTDAQKFLSQMKLTIPKLQSDLNLQRKGFYIKAIEYFADLFLAMLVNDEWFKLHRHEHRTFIEELEELLDRISSIPDKPHQSDVHVILVELWFEIKDAYQKLQLPHNLNHNQNKNPTLCLFFKARNAFEELLDCSNDSGRESDEESEERMQPYELEKMGKRYHEMAKRLLKLEEITLKVKGDNRDNELFLRLVAFFDLTVKSIFCIEENADGEYYKDQRAIPFRRKADKYFEAIEAFGEGDVAKALAYEQEALNIVIEIK